MESGNPRTAPCVPKIQAEVRIWRARGYPGATATSKTLLNHWFRPGGHRMRGGRTFEYHGGQREAVETVVYLHEVAKVDGFRALVERYTDVADLRLLAHDLPTRRAIKMATGTGKTKVISLLVVWHAFNAMLEDPGRYATSFLVLAPNVIVYERLVDDFRNGAVFRRDPVIPDEFAVYRFADEFRCYLKGEPEGPGSQFGLYVTNVQQVQDEEAEAPSFEDDPMAGVLGHAGGGAAAKDLSARDFPARIAARGGLIAVMNDEAHHTHDEASAWNKAIRRLNETSNGRVIAQYDVSATPRHNSGSLFAWTVSDYPLRQAITDGYVKRPVVGTGELTEVMSDVASTRYGVFLAAGVARLQEYRTQLAPLEKRPVLFVMANDTHEADDIADWMRRTYPALFAGEGLHVIHTKRNGEMSDAQLKEAREIARKVDDPASGINAIVSVLMLKEGWDVQNVTVVVGLRPYNAAAGILPEQTVGRGLRLMFRNVVTSYVERVDVIGTPKFIELIENLEKEEGMELERAALKKPLVIQTVAPVLPEKAAMDIALPILTPILVRRGDLAEELARVVMPPLATPLPRGADDETAKRFRYEGKDLVTLETIVDAEYEVPKARTAGEVVAFYAKLIAQDVKLPSLFSVLAILVRDYLRDVAFGERVDLDGPGMVAAISTNVAQHVVRKEFGRVLRPIAVEERIPELTGETRPLSGIAPFPHGKNVAHADKTIFNVCATDNDFEELFGRFLEASPDVSAFAKLPARFFAIEYTDTAFRLRYYEPDFVARQPDGTIWLLETKGREDVDVARKDASAIRWCEEATRLTGTPWRYLKVPETDFALLRPTDMSQLRAL